MWEFHVAPGRDRAINQINLEHRKKRTHFQQKGGSTNFQTFQPLSDHHIHNCLMH